MIRAIRPKAMAQDDAAMVPGWNVAPNLAYTLRLIPGEASCGVLLYDEAGTTLIATGAALTGTAQPCVLLPQTGQTVEMVDGDLGWHLLITTIGTESQRTIRLGPAVDLPDEIHPVYGDDGLALARATAAIDAAAHYVDDVTVTCPLGLGAGLGDVVSVPVDGGAVVGQVESITWTATPDGAIETAVIRRHVAIAPEPVVEITPPAVVDDTGTATHVAGTSGNVLTNDATGLTVVAVNGLSGNVGVAVDGDNGGTFTINADGSWAFAPDGDFALLEDSETTTTSVTYHASDGTSEAMATLTVTVSRANTSPVAVGDTGETTADATTSGNVLTNDMDTDLDALTVSKVAGSTGNVGQPVAGSNGGLFTIGSNGAWTFDPDEDFDTLAGEDTATTSVTYHVSDGVAEDEGILTVTVSAASSAWTPSEITTALWLDADDAATITQSSGVIQWADKSGNNRHATPPLAAKPTYTAGGIGGRGSIVFPATAAPLLVSSFAAPTGSAGLLVAYVAKKTGEPVYYSNTLTYGAVNAQWSFILASSSTQIADATVRSRCFWRNRSADSSQVKSASNFGVNTPRVVVATLKDSDGMALFFDGNSEGTRSAATHTLGSSAALTIGSSPDSSYSVNRFQGQIGEIVVVYGDVSTTTRQKIEGYLAHKWGLSVSLPTGHPYKDAAPTI